MNKERIPGGAFVIARKIFYSGIWLKHPLFLKTFLWCLGRASYEDHEKNGFFYKRGEFVTTYDEVIKATSYHHKRKHIFPTLKQIRTILKWLVDEGMIIVEPIREIDANPLKPERIGADIGADIRTRTRAYVGIKIIVVNYGTYQDSENYRGRHKGRHKDTNKGTIIIKDTIKVKKTPSEISEEISLLLNRYSDQKIINQGFEAISSTRKSNKIADTVKLSILQAWDQYPVESVIAGIRKYLEKGRHLQGKKENYLLAIIKDQKPVTDQGAFNGPRYKEITRENEHELYEN